ncbi:hypothetical protein VroAM7_05060 [Vibrio rotiferianus]|uniref:Tyr recombinase domain-containing protein n=1 Tax=Vibrio rotiferianus TaxID=190895 RepID=A0A510I2J6_9VIBR|nr:MULTISPECIES: tyrosine-type recombinase/integrase [Vibrio harveyi group]EKY4195858.1 site-specific integrase [Vibrio harveyi]BBL87853.1 hypothetical protein VroAM7_05060 [Vibrio rotiferianus]
MSRKNSSQIKAELESLLESYRNEPKLLLNIPITHSKKFGAVPSNKYLQETVGATQAQLLRYPELIELIRGLMIEYEVILPEEIASALEIRRNMKVWWASLSLEEKFELKIFGNSIQFKNYIPNYRGGKNYKIVAALSSEFNDELLELGILDKNYVLSKDRAALRDSNIQERAQKKRDEWAYLSDLPLEDAGDLTQMTNNTEPYVQVRQLFAAKLKSVDSDSGISNYKIAYKHFVDFLIESSVPSDTPLEDILEEFLLSRFRKNYILPNIDNKNIAPSSAATIISCLRQTLKRATQIKNLGFTTFYDVEGIEDVGRVTDMYRPYSLGERKQINDALASDISQTKQLMEPYVYTGVGEYPLNSDYHVIPKKGTLDNARFLFENHLGCEPVFYGHTSSVFADAFLRIILSNDVELHQLYKDWGVIPVVDRALIAPFVLRLAQITGINSDSICALEIDDYLMHHKITSRPCLTYWKERSGGEKPYHLDIFKAELQWLTVSQSKAVKDIFDTVIALTKEIRKDAPAEISKRLFIIKSTGRATYGKVMAIESLTSYFNNYVSKHSIVNDDGDPTQLNIARFRPTFVSELIEKDVSIREIQLMLGHKYLSTTTNYLDRLDFSRVARQKLYAALKKIHTGALAQKNKSKRPKRYLDNEDQVVFTTPLGGCANIFDPPDFIRNSSAFVEGQACSQYNKCLGCENVMLIASHIPELFAMRRDYLLLMQNSRIMTTPYGVVIQENLSLLEEILTPGEDGFSKKELDEGERLSLFVETNIIDSAGA